MRLIDADKLTYCFVDKENYIEGFNCVLEEEIAKAETVDAIPIERLEQEIDCYIDLGLNSVAKELRTIINEWRKENESNDM